MRTRSNRPASRWVAAVGIIGTVALAVGAFSLSFTSLMHLALRSGIEPSQAWEWPLIVDGMIIVATVGVVARAGRPGTGFAWLLLVCGALTSVAGNALQAARLPTDEPTWIAALVATIPPTVLLACTHMAVILTRPDPTAPETPAKPTTTVAPPQPTTSEVPTQAAGPALVGTPPPGKQPPLPEGTAPSPRLDPSLGLPAVPVMASQAPASEPEPGVDGPSGDGSRTWKAGKALSLRHAGLSVTEIAQAMDVSTGSVRRWLKPSSPIDEPTQGVPE
ncbi:MAG: DUF2637 domain-containing protein [Micrococcales bacterium]|nr:DUF2637 domain-containing protein [Micrococcales bacterium]